MGDFCVCVGHSCNILYLSCSNGKIKEHRERKGHQLFYGASRKKKKADTSQIMKKGKGKWKGPSSESEEESESKDDEIEAMFAESSESEREKWAQSVERRGFHCERGMKIETFLFTHPIRVVI